MLNNGFKETKIKLKSLFIFIRSKNVDSKYKIKKNINCNIENIYESLWPCLGHTSKNYNQIISSAE